MQINIFPVFLQVSYPNDKAHQVYTAAMPTFRAREAEVVAEAN